MPDKRLCFDFFQPLSTTGHVIDGRSCTRHSQGVLFDHGAYFALRGNEGAWIPSTSEEVTLANTLAAASNVLTMQTSGEYQDAHKWRFTPASFQLLMLELNLLRLTPWALKETERASSIEFYVWLERRELHFSSEEIEAQRLRLVREIIMETKEQVVQLEPKPVAPAQPMISAIIPL